MLTASDADRLELSASSFPDLEAALAAIRSCRRCVEEPRGAPLPHAPRPVLRVSSTARLLIAGQAPGARVHRSGTPFTDPSGDRLRDWMGVDAEAFYDASRVAVAPMGFCFPGVTAAKADRPPRRECRELWHDSLFAVAPQVDLLLAVGRYAQDYHLPRLGHLIEKNETVAARVARWRDHLDARPVVFPLPHPSWRNTAWIKRHPWFETELLPRLRIEVARVLSAP